MLPSRSRTLLIIVGVCLVGLIGSLPATSQPLEHYTDMAPNAVPTPPAAPGSPAQPEGGLVFYADRGAFMSDFPGLTSEDFTGTSVPATSVESCTPPMNSALNDACFSPGAIVEGLSVDVIQNTGDGAGVVLTPTFAGTTSVSVGANSFADDMVIDLSVPARALGLDLVCPAGPATIDIEIIGVVSGSLGSTTVACGGPPGTFWGVGASESILQVNFVGQTENDGELASNVLFGGAPVPTVQAPALAVLFLVLLAGSTLFIWRRRTV